MEILDLNHVALHVQDLDISVAFYRDKIGLPDMARPDFPFPGAWFRIGSVQELHLIAGREIPVVADKRGTHFAFQVDSIEAAWERMESRGVAPYSRQTRPDGAFQFYVDDPDGHVIEFCQINHLDG
jgi:catechol 2,3-dioxygenase-like lactoylglutathione lyase family enzyme